MHDAKHPPGPACLGGCFALCSGQLRLLIVVPSPEAHDALTSPDALQGHVADVCIKDPRYKGLYILPSPHHLCTDLPPQVKAGLKQLSSSQQTAYETSRILAEMYHSQLSPLQSCCGQELPHVGYTMCCTIAMLACAQWY